MTYRRRIRSDTWHFHERCQHWPTKGYVEKRLSKPKSGELCDECRAKVKRDAKR